MGKKTTKPSPQDKMSAFASSFNAAVTLEASGDGIDDDASIEDIAEGVIDLTISLYEARIAAQAELGLGGQSKNSSSGGHGGSGGRSGGSRSNSGKSDSATRGQIDYASDIIGRIEADGDDPPVSLKKFKKLDYDDASKMLDKLIKLDPK
jgi:hypothetical protein